MIGLLEVGVGGLIGAPTRFAVDQVISSRNRGAFPWGTFTVNVVGAFVLGLLDGLVSYQGLGPLAPTIVGTGFCGALTTFSTFSYETVRLLEEGAPAAAAWNVAGSVIAGLLSAGAGMALAAVL